MTRQAPGRGALERERRTAPVGLPQDGRRTRPANEEGKPMQLASSSAFLRRTARAALLGLAAATLAAGPEAVAADTESPSWPFGRADGPMGDDLDGVNGQTFSGSSLQLIARALVEAEAGENGGTVTLLVRRSGQGDSADELEIKLKLKTTGPEALHPAEGKGRRHIRDEALAWLAWHQEGGGFPQTFSGMNGAVVATSGAPPAAGWGSSFSAVRCTRTRRRWSAP